MGFVENVLLVLSAVFTLASFASLIKWDDWWVRIFDFPRIQVAFVLALLAVISIWIYNFSETWHFVATGLVTASFVFQSSKIFPYTWLGSKQVVRHRGHNSSRTVSVLISNVLTPNRNADALVQLVEKKKPDILLTLESDSWWEEQLSVLEKDYPYRVKKPMGNLYGMHLYSKLELENPQVKFIVQEDIPSIHSVVRLRSEDRIKIHCLHPRPPSPEESLTSTHRDAEILVIGKSIDTTAMPVLVLGDLNDVAWSRTTRLFLKLSGLLDPRMGRGFFNTFNAKYWFIRWPLDHLFHSNDFTLIDILRLPHIGSDHFPMLISLYLEPKAVEFQEEPEATEEEVEWAKDKIDKVELNSPPGLGLS